MADREQIDSPENDDTFPEGATDPGEMLYAEIHATISRCAKESNLRSYATLGVLEAIKGDVLRQLQKQNAEE